MGASLSRRPPIDSSNWPPIRKVPQNIAVSRSARPEFRPQNIALSRSARTEVLFGQFMTEDLVGIGRSRFLGVGWLSCLIVRQ